MLSVEQMSKRLLIVILSDIDIFDISIELAMQTQVKITLHTLVHIEC